MTLRVWDAVSGQSLNTLKGHTDAVNACAFSPEGDVIISASADNTLRVWDAAHCQSLHILEGHTETVRACAFSPNGRFILSGSFDETLRIWHFKSGKLLRTRGHRHLSEEYKVTMLWQ
jgi:WD40 repeat protein